MLALIKRATEYQSAIAIINNGRSYTYEQLLKASEKIASLLLKGRIDLKEEPVCFMVNPGFDYVAVQWGIWRAGGIAVPLCLTHPIPSLRYVVEDTGSKTILHSPEYLTTLSNLEISQPLELLLVGNWEDEFPLTTLPEISIGRKAMILYTSGTTNKPKGVVSTHHNLEAQFITLVKAWQWSSGDHTLCVLPLHHVHGIVNVICCALYSGAKVEFLSSFSPSLIFDLFEEGSLNVFMAVPTIYYKLISYWETLPEEEQQKLFTCMKAFRLMVCGSAALPVSVMEKWKTVSGHNLLERYGMTEIGMAISNPYEGERRAGYVGIPLPGVSIRLANDDYSDSPAGEPGEILVKGENVFAAYWNNSAATVKEFTPDGWFKTGDIAIVENGYYRIMGRKSVDIIKSGGYKISALEIEEVLRTHEEISDCAVVGLPDDEWGELIVAAIVSNNKNIDTDFLNQWLREKIPSYKSPRKYLVVTELPRNAMGKVTKNDVKKLFEK